MSPTISYLIFTHNEGRVYIQPLLDKLLKYKHEDDEIIVVDDFSDEKTTLDVLDSYKDKVDVRKHKFNKNFADHKNFGKDLCTKEIIFQIDADEIPSDGLLMTIKEIVLVNEGVDLYFLPRVNVVSGLTNEDIAKWGWQITEFKGAKLVNWPDPQGRIWINKPEIKWVGAVHERLVGHSKHTGLPAFDVDGNLVLDYALLHNKDIERQRNQNNLYDNIK